MNGIYLEDNQNAGAIAGGVIVSILLLILTITLLHQYRSKYNLVFFTEK